MVASKGARTPPVCPYVKIQNPKNSKYIATSVPIKPQGYTRLRLVDGASQHFFI